MICEILYGKCEKIDGPRVRVSVPGYSGDAGLDCLLLQPCAGGPSVWCPPAVGDVVAVAVDTERLDDSLVLGVVYPDGKEPPKTGPKQAAVAFDEVYLGNPTPDKKCTRDDRLQAQLSAIKTALDTLVSVYNAHTHAVAEGVAAATTDQQTNEYSVGDTASDCVWVK